MRTGLAARVTGLGAFTPLGEGVDALWRGVIEGLVAVGPSRRLRLGELAGVPVGEIEADAPPGEDRALWMARRAAGEAMRDAGWPADGLARPDAALLVATTKGSLLLGQHALEGRTCAESLHDLPLFALAARLAASLRATGIVQTVSVSCASGTTALGQALRLVRQARAGRVLVVGVDTLSEFVVRGFFALRALAADRARPFDVNRSGLVVGEGAAALAVEAGEGPARALLCGYGGSNDAEHITGPSRDGAGLQRAVRAALSDAGRDAEQIDALSAHGTGTPFNDAMEGRAFSAILGARRVPVHGLKGAIGHAMGAAGAIEAAVCVRGIEEGLWPPTAGLQTLDPAIPLDVVHGAPRRVDARVVVSTSSGFSGINAAVVLCRP